MKKFFCFAIAITSLLLLVACGSSGSSTPEQMQTSTAAVAPDTPSNEVPDPELTPRLSLDAVIDEVLYYAEEENMVVDDEIATIIKEKYDEGIDDPYIIFLFLCDDGLLSSAPVTQNGIIVFKLSYGSSYSYNSTGKQKCVTFTAQLDSIDPETGAVQHLRTFSSEDTRSCSAYFYSSTGALPSGNYARRRMRAHLLMFGKEASKG